MRAEYKHAVGRLAALDSSLSNPLNDLIFLQDVIPIHLFAIDEGEGISRDIEGIDEGRPNGGDLLTGDGEGVVISSVDTLDVANGFFKPVKGFLSVRGFALSLGEFGLLLVGLIGEATGFLLFLRHGLEKLLFFPVGC